MENRLGLPSQSATANYAVVDRQTLDPVFRFQADDLRAANRIYGEWLAATGLPATTEDYGFQEIRPGQPEEAESSLWAVRRISDDNSQPMGPTLTIRARDEQAARDQVRRDYPEYEFAWLDVQPAEDNAVPEVPMDVAQNFPDRTDGRNIDYSFRDLFGNTDQASSAPAGNSFSGQWRVMIDGEEVWRFRGVGNNQADANRIAQTWLQDQRRQGSLSPAPGADIEVLPVMIESVQESLTEIAAMPAHQFAGGKDMLDYMPPPSKKRLRPLPGGTDLMYAIETMGPETRVQIVDPGMPGITRPVVVAVLNLDPSSIPNTVQVGSITVDEDYRGRGLAKSLYGIVLTIMRKNLVSGSSQTPGGRRNWLSLATIPGVEVQGLVNSQPGYGPGTICHSLPAMAKIR
jgi:GNAT superfamily N-acetyltransferase